MAPITPTNDSGARKRRVARPRSGMTPHLPRETTIAEAALHDSQDTGQDNPTTPPDQDKEPFRDRKITGLLRLPCELLQIIGSKLTGSRDILHFALVNKHVNGIILETMARNLVISKKQIKRLLEMLVSHPALIIKVSSVDLGDYGCNNHEDCLCLGTPHSKPEIMKLLGPAIAANTQNTISWNHIRQAKRTPGPVWRKNQAYFLDVLLSLCPNIKSIRVELPEARPFNSDIPPRPVHLAPHHLPAPNPELIPVAPLQGPALQMMQQNLEELIIAEDTRWKGPITCEVLEHQDISWRNTGKYTITLAGFSRLKRLDVPMDVLGRPQDVVFLVPNIVDTAADNAAADEIGKDKDDKLKSLAGIREKVLPLTLQYLHLRCCNKWTFALLKKVNQVPVEQLRLKHIELFFTSRPQDIIMQCDATDKGRLNYICLLSELHRKGVKVSFYTGPKEMVVDMRKELEAISVLSPFEVWQFVISGIPFTELNAEASRNRRVLSVGSRLFLRHAKHHLKLFNSPTFNAESWAQGAFFHGIKDTKRYPNILSPKLKVITLDPSRWSLREDGKHQVKRRLAALLSLDTFEFTFRVEQALGSTPIDVPFLGVTFNIPSAGTRHHRRKDEEKIPGQGHGTDCTLGSKNDESNSSCPTEGLPFAKDSKFDSVLWSGVLWKASL
ncbi:hypothetical protein EJ02DRAFT_399525 [Clathrospora elynae]|uniref:F-box domain-containing protein n=1 Tax=Clathrospora elynae TaxID=706981 RepID=A0A6A5SVA4_9PLEO|nr:hypothetical protein EJ02DRAFT_399525 [Clathrospora elynae]